VETERLDERGGDKGCRAEKTDDVEKAESLLMRRTALRCAALHCTRRVDGPSLVEAKGDGIGPFSLWDLKHWQQLLSIAGEVVGILDCFGRSGGEKKEKGTKRDDWSTRNERLW